MCDDKMRGGGREGGDPPRGTFSSIRTLVRVSMTKCWKESLHTITRDTAEGRRACTRRRTVGRV